MPRGINTDIELELVIPEGNPYTGTYVWKLGDCTGLDDLAVKEATGLPLIDLAVQALTQQVGMQLVFVAAIVWLHRRKNGFAHNTFEEVASKLPWSVAFDLKDNTVPDDEAGKVESEGTSQTSGSPDTSQASTESDPGNSTLSPSENATT